MADPAPLAPEARSFATVASEYERARPSYAPAAVAALADALHWSPDGPVLDVGAGTGKFSVLVAQRGVPVIAVEPIAEMRARIPRPAGLSVLDGSADAIPLPDGACASAVAATAFHWFATEPALRELVRVTRPPHRLGLVWNDRDHAVDWVQAYDAIMERYTTDAPRYRHAAWRDALRGFGAVVGDCLRFPNPQPTTPQGVVERGLSTSFIAALDDARRANAERELRALADTLPARLDFPYTTDVYVVTLRPA